MDIADIRFKKKNKQKVRFKNLNGGENRLRLGGIDRDTCPQLERHGRLANGEDCKATLTLVSAVFNNHR